MQLDLKLARVGVCRSSAGRSYRLFHSAAPPIAETVFKLIKKVGAGQWNSYNLGRIEKRNYPPPQTNDEFARKAKRAIFEKNEK